MKSSVVRGDCVDIVTSYLVSRTRLGYGHCEIFLYIVYIIYSRIIVLYSRYRANRATNMTIVFVNVILILFMLPLCLGCILGVSQLGGRYPPCHSLHNSDS